MLYSALGRIGISSKQDVLQLSRRTCWHIVQKLGRRNQQRDWFYPDPGWIATNLHRTFYDGSNRGTLSKNQRCSIQKAAPPFVSLCEPSVHTVHPVHMFGLDYSQPEAAEGVIVVSFALNEPGTAYCRATRRGFRRIS